MNWVLNWLAYVKIFEASEHVLVNAMQVVDGQIELHELFEVNERARFDAFNVARTQIKHTKRAKAYESVLLDASQIT